MISIRQKSPDIRLLTDSFCYSSASQGQPSLAGHAPLSQTVHRTVWEIHPVPGALRMEISPSAEGDQGLMVPKGNHTVCKQTVPAQFSFGKLSGSLANRGPRKPLKRLDLNFYIITVPTLCETELRRSARRSNHRIVSAICSHESSIKYRTIYPARSLWLLLSRPSGLRSRSDRREQGSGSIPLALAKLFTAKQLHVLRQQNTSLRY